MRSATLLLALVGATVATTGFDAIGAITSSQFQCMKTNGHSFYIGRVYRSSGTTDTQGVQNMANGLAGGMAHVDGYIFPCTTSGCPTPAAQVQAAVTAAKGVKYGQMWLDIEIYKWSSDLTTNRNFIMAMAKELDAQKVSWGVYSSLNNWQNVVGLDWHNLSAKPLWWATYNNQANLGSFKAFGGWTVPTIHQYAGDVAGPCKFQVDLNYY